MVPAEPQPSTYPTRSCGAMEPQPSTYPTRSCGAGPCDTRAPNTVRARWRASACARTITCTKGWGEFAQDVFPRDNDIATLHSGKGSERARPALSQRVEIFARNAAAELCSIAQPCQHTWLRSGIQHIPKRGMRTVCMSQQKQFAPRC